MRFDPLDRSPRHARGELKRARTLLLRLLLVTLAGCRGGERAAYQARDPGAFARLHDRSGQEVGSVVFTERAAALHAEAELREVAPGTYLLELHSRGACDRHEEKAFASAGVPVRSRSGRRAGAAVYVGGAGPEKLHFDAPGLTLAPGAGPVFDADGSAVVLVDLTGARVACGVVRR